MVAQGPLEAFVMVRIHAGQPVFDRSADHDAEGEIGSSLPHGFQGQFYPVNPSTLLVSKHLQKFDPSGHPSEAVSEPSGPPRTIRLSPGLIQLWGLKATPMRPFRNRRHFQRTRDFWRR
jgi:hypothetical protein